MKLVQNNKNINIETPKVSTGAAAFPLVKLKFCITKWIQP